MNSEELENLFNGAKKELGIRINCALYFTPKF